MTPEERAAQLAEEWFSRIWSSSNPEQKLAEHITPAIRAAVAEAMVIEGEVCAARLDVAAAQYRKMKQNGIGNALEHEAASIRARSRGEGEG